jgi:hypothetical protein
METEWPFDQEPKTTTLTTRQVFDEGFPILNVVHYSDDHSWAFTCGTTDDPDDGLIVHMSHLIDLDPSLTTIADLPPGWLAEREQVGGEWDRWKDDEY